MLSSAIVEFTGDGPRQQDIEMISRSPGDDYVVCEVSEILHPGSADETRRLVEDAGESGLLVTPEKSVLSGGGRKLLRFVALRDADAQEHIYRVAVKPVIKGVANDARVGLKILVGYEVLVIMRPANIQPAYSVHRAGKLLNVENKGNSDVLLQNGQQCNGACVQAPVLRVYAGQKASVELPLDKPVHYSVWDGATMQERDVE